jgi:hypothetical protein
MNATGKQAPRAHAPDAECVPRALRPAVARGTPSRPALRATCAIALLTALAIPACGVRPGSPFGGVRIDPAALTNPFAPTSMQIHPLTRIDRDSAGLLWIICHIELRDAWNDPVKGAGQVQLQLYRPAGRLSGTGVQELTWDVDLTDLERKAALYDAATRTYRFPLREAPQWLADAPDTTLLGPAGRGLLRAVFTTAGPQGEALELQHEFVLQ